MLSALTNNNKLHTLSNNSKGFTLVELLITVTIITLLTSFLIPGFTRYSSNQAERQSREQIRNDIRSVQNNALSGVGSTTINTHWAIRFDDNSGDYIYFKTPDTTWGSCTSPIDTTTDSDLMPNNNVIRNGTVCLFFSFENGDVTYIQNNGAVSDCSTSGDCVITVGSTDNSDCESVEVNTAGRVQSFGTATCEY